MNKGDLKKETKGITLIALIITIIVLLILAGVTISAITGNESVMEKAKEAKEKNEEVAKQEQIELDKVSSKLEPEWDGTVADSFAEGSGNGDTEGTAYKIENGAQLAYLAAVVNGEKTPPTGATATFEGKFISITKSINLGNKEFTPIGLGDSSTKRMEEDDPQWSTEKSFKGTINGNNNIITGLNINKVNNFGVGLIGVLETGGTAQNIIVYEGKVIGIEAVGGVVGASRGTILNCQNSAEIIAQDNSAISQSGELAGGIVGLVSNGNIDNCKNYGNVTTKDDCDLTGRGKYAGGIIGGVFKTTQEITISNCKNYGNVLVTYQLGGGIVGSIYYSQKVTILNCENSGNVSTGTSITLATVGVGGIIGNIPTGVEAEITNCSNSGTITVNRQSSGGIVGKIGAGNITNCFNTGEIIANSQDGRGISGGIIGTYKGGTISDVFNSGNVTVQHLNTNTLISVAGGIVGLQTDGSIEKAYNKGNILGDGEVKGGVAGQKPGGTLSKTYFYSQINNASINGIGTTTSSKDINTQLSPVSTAEGEVESTTANYTLLNDFLKNIQ